mgnify:CR=1 FL=1
MAASTSTLSIPTPARPITLRLSRTADEVRRHLRRRADDDRIVGPDRFREVGVPVDVDVEAAFAQEADSCLGDRFADEDPAQTGVRSAQASSARVTATPRSIWAPASVSASSTAARAVVMIEHVEPADVPDPEDLSLQVPLPVGDQ